MLEAEECWSSKVIQSQLRRKSAQLQLQFLLPRTKPNQPITLLKIKPSKSRLPLLLVLVLPRTKPSFQNQNFPFLNHKPSLVLPLPNQRNLHSNPSFKSSISLPPSPQIQPRSLLPPSKSPQIYPKSAQLLLPRTKQSNQLIPNWKKASISLNLKPQSVKFSKQTKQPKPLKPN